MLQTEQGQRTFTILFEEEKDSEPVPINLELRPKGEVKN
jgi:hypothetical protein